MKKPRSHNSFQVLQEHLDAMCPELQLVLADAEECGNPVIETWTEFGQGAMLKAPKPVLEGVPADVKAKLIYKDINDPHYWLSEIHCREHSGCFIALPYPR